MALSSDTDASTPKFLRGKYAICGVGETTYRRGSEESTRNLATWAINNALADAGMEADDIDGMLNYSGNDSVFAPQVANDLGIRLNFYMDVHGGGSSTAAPVRGPPFLSSVIKSIIASMDGRVPDKCSRRHSCAICTTTGRRPNRWHM